MCRQAILWVEANLSRAIAACAKVRCDDEKDERSATTWRLKPQSESQGQTWLDSSDRDEAFLSARQWRMV